MVYNYLLDYAAILLDVLLIALVFIRKNVRSNRLILFKLILFCHLIACIFDILSTKAINSPLSYSLSYCNITTIIFYLFHNGTAFLFVLYGIVSERMENNRKLIVICESIFLIVSIIIITSPLTKLVFYFNSDMSYNHGVLLYALYIICYIEILYVFYLKIRNFKRLNNFEIVCNFMYLIMILFVFIYNLLDGQIIVEMFFISTAFLVMYISETNPEKYLYKGIEVFNRNAFDEKMIELFSTKKKFSILFFTLKESEKFKSNSNILFAEEKRILDLVKNEKDINSNLYVIDDLIFAIICDDIEHYIIEINKLVNLNNNESSRLSFGVFRCPEMCDEYIKASNIIDDLSMRLPLNLGDEIVEGNTDVNISIEDKEIEKYLRNAINSKEVFIGLEPIFDVLSNYAKNLQTYVYILGDNNDKIPFSVFAKIAKRNNLLDQIDDIVLDKVCEFLIKIEKISLGTSTIYVPVSPYRLLNKNFIDQLHTLKVKHHLPDGKLGFMMSNIRTVSSSKFAIDTMHKASALGFRFSIENEDIEIVDLAALSKMPINIMKLDARLYRNDIDNSKLDIIISNIIKLCKELDIDTLLSNINTIDEYNNAKNAGFNYVKGKFFTPLYTDDEYIKFMQNQTKTILNDISFK